LTLISCQHSSVPVLFDLFLLKTYAELLQKRYALVNNVSYICISEDSKADVGWVW